MTFKAFCLVLATATVFGRADNAFAFRHIRSPLEDKARKLVCKDKGSDENEDYKANLGYPSTYNAKVHHVSHVYTHRQCRDGQSTNNKCYKFPDNANDMKHDGHENDQYRGSYKDDNNGGGYNHEYKHGYQHRHGYRHRHHHRVNGKGEHDGDGDYHRYHRAHLEHDHSTHQEGKNRDAHECDYGGCKDQHDDGFEFHYENSEDEHDDACNYNGDTSHEDYNYDYYQNNVQSSLNDYHNEADDDYGQNYYRGHTQSSDYHEYENDGVDHYYDPY